MSPPLSFFQRGGWGRLRAREPQIIWEIGLVAGGIALMGWTLSLYPAFDSTAHAPASQPTLSSSAADRQIDAAKSYLTSHPDDFNTHIALAMAYYGKGPDHYIEAMNALEKARSLGATSENLFFYAGVMYDALGLPDYAINEFSKYLRHHPRDYESMIRLANLYFRQKQLDEAVALYKDALHMWPKDATAWFNYAVINKEKGNYPLALGNLDQVSRIAGRLPAGGLYQKGEIYRLQGDAQQALKHYQQELINQPAFVPALEATESIVRAQGDLKQSRELRKRIAELKKQQQIQARPKNAVVQVPSTIPIKVRTPEPAPVRTAPAPAPVRAPAAPAPSSVSESTPIVTPAAEPAPATEPVVPISTGDTRG